MDDVAAMFAAASVESLLSNASPSQPVDERIDAALALVCGRVASSPSVCVRAMKARDTSALCAVAPKLHLASDALVQQVCGAEPEGDDDLLMGEPVQLATHRSAADSGAATLDAPLSNSLSVITLVLMLLCALAAGAAISYVVVTRVVPARKPQRKSK